MKETVIVGGLVPSLLVDQSRNDPHVGTMDLDIGLSPTIFDEQMYQELSVRLRRAGFGPDENQEGNRTRQRWTRKERRVTVDFLIAPSATDDKQRRIRNIESDFAALITPGLYLAFSDREKVRITGRTIAGETAVREIWVAGPLPSWS